jgi:hypothetical protein
VTVRLEALGLGELIDGLGHTSLERGGGSDVDDLSAVDTEEVMVVLGEVLGVINAIGAENEYADVLGQIGGRYVHVSSILNNPNTDPHTFESSPSVAEEVSAAQLIVQNGVGYDTFMNKIESASPNSARKVIVVQTCSGCPTARRTRTCGTTRRRCRGRQGDGRRPVGAAAAHAAYFQANLKRFDASLTPWFNAIAAFKAKYGGRGGDHRAGRRLPAQAMGIDNLTPFGSRPTS